jgi:hypothetical protein
LERGRFIWPSPADGKVVISPAQLGMLLEGIEADAAADVAAAARWLACDKLTQPLV